VLATIGVLGIAAEERLPAAAPGPPSGNG